MTAAVIFLLTYIVLAVGRFPGLRIDRTGAAIIGASAMVAANVLSLDEAYRAINFDTIILLFGMMIVVANLQLSGFFALISERVVEHAHRRLALLAAIVVVAGLFSAFFVNDTMCLVLTPLVLEITSAMRAKPVPYLLGIAMGANIGSAATITGNPQNMLIGAYSGIDYRVFAGHLAPVAAAGLLITILFLYVAYRSEFRSRSTVQIERVPVRIDRLLLWKSVTVAAGMIVFFFAGWPTPKVAIVAGALLLITRRIEPEEIYRRIDWGLLVMFAGLFIVVAGFEKTPFEHDLKDFASRLHFDNVFVLSAVSAVLSNIVSNVPAVLVFKPLMAQIADPLHAWLTLAMSSTFAGNLTVLGSVANLIVIEQARGKVDIGFWEYLRVGAPLAIVTILMGAFWLANT